MSRRLVISLGVILVVALALAAVFLLSDPERLDLDAAVRGRQPGSSIRLDQGDVYYEWSGPSTGPVVVLVNPFSVPLYVWERNSEALARDGFRVLRYDLYGRGFSDRPRTTYDLDLFVGQLDRLLRGLAVVEPVDLAGVSMGAGIAAAFTARNPGRVGKLCLVDPPAAEVTWTTIFPMNIGGIGEVLMAAYVIPFVLSSPRGDFYQPQSVPDWGSRFKEQTTYRGFRRALLSTLRRLPRDYLDWYADVGALGKPVLLVWGERDTTEPVSKASVVLSAIPQADLRVIPDAGHLSNYERADLVNPILRTFFAGRQ